MQPTNQTDLYSLYHGDCCEVLPTLADDSAHLSVYSPPFCGLYHYSSSERDMSNCRSRDEFLQHYNFLVEQIARVTMPGRLTAVHCMDVPTGGGILYDLPGDIVRLHEAQGMRYIARHAIWKEPLGVRMRTMAKGLAHKQIVEDSAYCDVAGADYLLLFRKRGDNPISDCPSRGIAAYAGERKIPEELHGYRGWQGKQTENRTRIGSGGSMRRRFGRHPHRTRRAVREGRDPDDEKHVHPLQLDVIERVVVLRSNPGETVLTPFMGVGSEIYGALLNGRQGHRGGAESVLLQAGLKNVGAACHRARP
jgi:DNA modification methylase